jgi:hypothetical protein
LRQAAIAARLYEVCFSRPERSSPDALIEFWLGPGRFVRLAKDSMKSEKMICFSRKIGYHADRIKAKTLTSNLLKPKALTPPEALRRVRRQWPSPRKENLG